MNNAALAAKCRKIFEANIKQVAEGILASGDPKLIKGLLRLVRSWLKGGDGR